ncbi:MAG: hypothetical protein V1492_02375, partial [Candidatus Micrarchaeota archaeon]
MPREQEGYILSLIQLWNLVEKKGLKRHLPIDINMNKTLTKKAIDPVQARLKEMELASPSRTAIKSDSFSTVRLAARTAFGLWKDKVVKVEQDAGKHVAPVGENDYHQKIPKDSDIKSYKVEEDGSVTTYYQGGSGSTRLSYKGEEGYLRLLVKARDLARDGNPAFERYYQEADRAHWHTRGGFRGRFETVAASRLAREAYETFKAVIGKPSGQVKDLMNDVTGLDHITAFTKIEHEKHGGPATTKLSFGICVTLTPGFFGDDELHPWDQEHMDSR